MRVCNFCKSHPLELTLEVKGRQIYYCSQCQIAETLPFEFEGESLYQDSAYFTEKNRYLESDSSHHQSFQHILDLVVTHKTSGRFLDIGCGPGVLLKLAKGQGWDVSGIEVSKWAVEYAVKEWGLNVTCSPLQENIFPDSSFDVVVANHSLEHMPNPNDALRVISKLLKKGGIAVIGVPNFASLMRRLVGKNWFSLLPDQHKWHFTTNGLKKLIEEHNLDIKNVEFENHVASSRNPIKRWGRIAINQVSLWSQTGEAMVIVACK